MGTEMISKAISESSIAVQLVIAGLVCYIMVARLIEANNYKEKRRHETVRAVMGFVDSTLKNIRSESCYNTKKSILFARGGTLTDSDYVELSSIRSACTVSLAVETVSEIKKMVKTNGYYKYWKMIKEGNADQKAEAKKQLDDLVYNRSRELRDISNDAVESVLRDDSPLVGMGNERFPYDKSAVLYRSIIEKHCTEIRLEEVSINAEYQRLLGGLSKLFVYKHEDDELY